MSTKALFQAFDLIKGNAELSCHEKLVLLVLADHVNRETGMAWPSVATLALETSISERQVQRALKGLSEKGALSVERVPNKTSRYTVVGGDKQSPQETRNCQTVTSRGDRQSPKPIKEPSGTEQDQHSELDLFHQHKNQHCAKQAPHGAVIDKEFEEGFWPKYRKHRPMGKQEAKAEYRKARKKHSSQQIMNGLAWHEARWKKEDTDNPSKPHACRFLKWGRYMDAEDDTPQGLDRQVSLDEIRQRLPERWAEYEQGLPIKVNGWIYEQGLAVRPSSEFRRAS